MRPNRADHLVGEPVDGGGIGHVAGRRQDLGSGRHRWHRTATESEAEPAGGEVGGHSRPDAPGGARDDDHRRSPVDVGPGHQSTVETNTFFTSL